jgi:hypothetical protein
MPFQLWHSLLGVYIGVRLLLIHLNAESEYCLPELTEEDRLEVIDPPRL